MRGRDLDEIADHVVVADLEGGDPGLLGVLALQIGDQASRLVAQFQGRVQFGRVALGDEAAVARIERRLGHQRRGEPVGEFAVFAQIVERFENARRRRHVARLGAELGAHLRQFAQPLADADEIARAPAPHGEALQGALQIGKAAQRLAQAFARARRRDEERDHVVACGDRGRIGQRCGQALRQKPRARCRLGAIDRGEQRAALLAGLGFDDLQRPARGRIDFHRTRLGDARRVGQFRQLALLGELDIVDERARGRDLGPAERAEAVEGFHAIQGFEPAPPVLAVEARAGQRREARLERLDRARERRVARQFLGEQQFARRHARQRGTQPRRVRRLDAEIAGRHIEPGEAQRTARFGQASEIIVGPRVEQRVLDQRPRCHHAHHVAAHHGFRAALFGFFGRFELFANRHPEALADQPREIRLVRMPGHPAHRDLLAEMQSALGQRQIERLRRRDRVVEEHLVEVAHAIEQQGVRILPLELQILRHHRGDSAIRFAGGGGKGIGHGGGEHKLGGVACNAAIRGAAIF